MVIHTQTIRQIADKLLEYIWQFYGLALQKLNIKRVTLNGWNWSWNNLMKKLVYQSLQAVFDAPPQQHVIIFLYF